ncbi:MAG TPA: GNAT family N-acetyltransferase, partial [Sphingomonadales bacterium]|nr:GNAT family N-acetyltransferase [Sphingomonadales bacterium]
MKTEALIAAVEDNHFAYLASFRKWNKVRVFDEPELLYLRSKIPFPLFNAHVRLQASHEEAKKRIAAAVRYAKETRLPLAWYTGPKTRPAGAGALLTRAGFEARDIAPGMAIAMAELKPLRAHGFAIRQVESAADFEDWRSVFEKGFRISPEVSRAFVAAYTAMGFTGASPAHHFTASVAGKVAGCASVFMGAGAAGIYNIATLPHYRRRGIGSVLTLQALHYSHAKGFRVGVLQASTEGLPMYRGLGFQEAC